MNSSIIPYLYNKTNRTCLENIPLYDKNINDLDFRLLSVLIDQINLNYYRSGNDSIKISQQILSECLNKSIRTIKRSIKKLIDNKYIASNRINSGIANYFILSDNFIISKDLHIKNKVPNMSLDSANNDTLTSQNCHFDKQVNDSISTNKAKQANININTNTNTTTTTETKNEKLHDDLVVVGDKLSMNENFIKLILTKKSQAEVLKVMKYIIWNNSTNNKEITNVSGFLNAFSNNKIDINYSDYTRHLKTMLRREAEINSRNILTPRQIVDDKVQEARNKLTEDEYNIIYNKCLLKAKTKNQAYPTFLAHMYALEEIGKSIKV